MKGFFIGRKSVNFRSALTFLVRKTPDIFDILTLIKDAVVRFKKYCKDDITILFDMYNVSINQFLIMLIEIVSGLKTQMGWDVKFS